MSVNKLYVDRHGGLSSRGHSLGRKVQACLQQIVNECVEDDVDLRIASYLVMQIVDSMFLEAIMADRLGPSRRKNHG